jgi:hypothetical protein
MIMTFVWSRAAVEEARGTVERPVPHGRQSRNFFEGARERSREPRSLRSRSSHALRTSGEPSGPVGRNDSAAAATARISYSRSPALRQTTHAFRHSRRG